MSKEEEDNDDMGPGPRGHVRIQLVVTLMVILAASVSSDYVSGLTVRGLPATKERASTTMVSLLPEQVFQTFIAEHSESSLQNENRRYVVGYYSCPNQAGNRLHDFFNSLILAMATNRTLLWKYYDINTCRQAHVGYNPKVCKTSNKLEECQAVLERAPWIPSYDEWAPKLGLPESLGPRNPDWQLQKLPNLTKAEKHPSWATMFDNQVVQTNRDIFMDEQIDATEFLRFLTVPEERQTLQNLFGEGGHFLYGMLFDEIFRPTLESGIQSAYQIPDDTVSIGVHIRHIRAGTPPNLSDMQRKCVLRTIRRLHRKRPQSKCVLLAMSDRHQEALDDLKGICENGQRCTMVVASHEHGKTPYRDHGPFAGVGFFQDLSVVGKARDGFVI